MLFVATVDKYLVYPDTLQACSLTSRSFYALISLFPLLYQETVDSGNPEDRDKGIGRIRGNETMTLVFLVKHVRSKIFMDVKLCNPYRLVIFKVQTLLNGKIYVSIQQNV